VVKLSGQLLANLQRPFMLLSHLRTVTLSMETMLQLWKVPMEHSSKLQLVQLQPQSHLVSQSIASRLPTPRRLVRSSEYNSRKDVALWSIA
jgi:hypothetical protein